MKAMLLKLFIGLALIALLLRAGLLDLGMLIGALRRPLPLLAAVAVLFGTLLVAAVRWQVLLRVQGILLPSGSTLRVVLAAAFFSTFLPGALGGDLLRSGYMLRAARGRASTGLLSIVTDRMLGLAGLLAVSALVALAHPRDIPRPLALALGALVCALALLHYALPLITRALARRVPPAARSWRAALAHSARELNTALATYHGARGTLAVGLALSMLICLLDIAGLLLVMRAMGIDALPWMQQALACSLALIANNLPLSPGGLGIGEAAFANVAIALEPRWTGAPYATAFLAYRCITVISTLPGAFVGVAPGARREAQSGRQQVR